MTSPPTPLLFSNEHILRFESLPSTNDYLKELAGSGSLSEGTVVWALNQTMGKGQRSNKWLSEPGQNLTLSILLKPNNIHPGEAFRISKCIAIAVYNTIAGFCKGNVAIKWPNDLFVDNRKIAGVLIENAIQGDQIKHAIVGIGINVNQTVFHSENNPTSLKNHERQSFELNEVANTLFNSIKTTYQLLQTNNWDAIEKDYFKKLYQTEKEQIFNIGGLLQKCFIKEVNPDGSILLSIDGKNAVYLHGDATWKI